MEHNQAVERLKQEIIADTGRILQGLPQGDASRFTVLIENFKPAGSDLKTTHGLSIYLERAGRSYLLDTGTGASTFENAAALGKDIAAVEAVFISHGHFDHGGGLARFFEINDQAKIYSSEAAVRERHFAEKDGAINKNISIDAALYERYPGRFHFVDRVAEIAEDLIVIPAIEQLFPLPGGNANLYRETASGMVKDNFKHEQILLIKEQDGFIVFSGCCHNGILNVIHTVRKHSPETPVKAVLGGFHLLNPDTQQLCETEQAVAALGQKLRAHAIGLYFTGHCTGLEAYTILKKELAGRLLYFHTGLEFTL
jgi:7,8-dihydropterin-6-yl-methyl-4-(beta-D-ribofuranosyl)aminobenzene 5'-phosphate synthase